MNEVYRKVRELSSCGCTQEAPHLHYVGEEVNDKFRSLSDCTPQAAASSTTQTLDYDAARSKLSAHFAP